MTFRLWQCLNATSLALSSVSSPDSWKDGKSHSQTSCIDHVVVIVDVYCEPQKC